MEYKDIAKQAEIESLDPIIYAINHDLKIDGEHPGIYAIENKMKIDGKDPALYLVGNVASIDNTSTTTLLMEKGVEIGGLPIEKYLFDKDVIIKALNGTEHSFQQVALANDWQIQGTSALNYGFTVISPSLDSNAPFLENVKKVCERSSETMIKVKTRLLMQALEINPGETMRGNHKDMLDTIENSRKPEELAFNKDSHVYKILMGSDYSQGNVVVSKDQLQEMLVTSLMEKSQKTDASKLDFEKLPKDVLLSYYRK